ncbi:hypothetical protein CLV24_12221 [Pontibacter ummariensis]|uniref:Tetratricopeptide repeat-containing protein n=1 Tax=Pontibacter ummariensis TaxID=1610492 RepID=A0A239JJ43_9BACT|nr:hypothetical protein [Pontibacter ummariensis]PRY07831.1 hypothetical protein CLV24_12221 [Pontibacter ummariensis]SNT05602.1 hypothetical protein SAMN06296052_12221 [Pontibacter ummariensis]
MLRYIPAGSACSTFTSYCRNLLALLLLFVFSAAGATDSPDYVKVYHPTIQRAELAILNEQYGEALNAYQQAFEAVPSAFARDYYNAAVCAMLLEEEKQAFSYLEKLVQKGASLPYLEQQQAFSPLQEGRRWKRFKRKYPKRRKAFEQAANLDLRADLDELYARDQYFRQAEGGYKMHRDTLRAIETANTLNLLNWIAEYGYPGEELIGVADTLEQLPRFSIVIQRQTRAMDGYDFTEILMQAVHDGKLAPQAAAYLMEQQAGKNRYSTKAFVKITCNGCKEGEQLKGEATYFVENMNPQELQRIDARREQLGLEPLEEYRRKVLYSLKEDNRFKLNFPWSVANYFVPNEEAAAIMKEKLITAE